MHISLTGYFLGLPRPRLAEGSPPSMDISGSPPSTFPGSMDISLLATAAGATSAKTPISTVVAGVPVFVSVLLVATAEAVS